MKTYKITVRVGSRIINTTIQANSNCEARALAEGQYGSGNVITVH